MKKLKSTSDIIRVTGSVREPTMLDDAQKLEWLNNLPFNSDVDETDIGVYVTVSGCLSCRRDGKSFSLRLPYFEIYLKHTDKNGNPFFQVRDVYGFEGDGTLTAFSDLQYLIYDVDDEGIVLTDTDPTA